MVAAHPRSAPAAPVGAHRLVLRRAAARHPKRQRRRPGAPGPRRRHHRWNAVIPQPTATRARPEPGSGEAGEDRGGLLGVVAGDVEVGDQADGGGADGGDQDARRRGPPRRSRRRRRAAPRRCWCPRSPGRRRRPRPAAGRARGRRPAARRGGRARAARRRPGCRPGACRRPSACARSGPRRSRRRCRPCSEPTGAPSPLDRQTASTSAIAPYSASGTPVATWAFQIRAPSMWTRAPTPVGELAQVAQVRDRQHRAAGEVVGVLDRDRRGGHEERPHVGGEQRLGSSAGRPGRAGGSRCAWSARCRRRGRRARRARCARWTRRAPPGRAPTSERTASTLAIEPVGMNSAASWPNSPATCSSSARPSGPRRTRRRRPRRAPSPGASRRSDGSGCRCAGRSRVSVRPCAASRRPGTPARATAPG